MARMPVWAKDMYEKSMDSRLEDSCGHLELSFRMVLSLHCGYFFRTMDVRWKNVIGEDCHFELVIKNSKQHCVYGLLRLRLEWIFMDFLVKVRKFLIRRKEAYNPIGTRILAECMEASHRCWYKWTLLKIMCG